jgi:hypothetical protein
MSITDRLRDMAIMAEEWQHPIIDDAIAALEGLAWPTPQPIETAPRDGAWILVWLPPDGHGRDGHWDKVSWCRYAQGFLTEEVWLNNPTHWLPLPPDPE